MSFLDGLGVTISQKSNEVASKTKDMVEITNMNGQIAKLQKTLVQQYQTLGEQYYAANKEAEADPFIGVIGEIRNTFAQMDELNAKINLLKNGKPANPVAQPMTVGSVFCRNCGSKLASDAVFCTVCGVKLSEAVPEGDQTEGV